MRGAIMPAIVTSLLKAAVIHSRTYQTNSGSRSKQSAKQVSPRASST